MSGEVLERSSSRSPAEPGFLECYSSSEASTRLAARLERSEYKRSRGKQRLHNQHGAVRTHGKRKDIGDESARKNGRRKTSALSPSNQPSNPSGDGVTSVWEVHGQIQRFYSDESFSHPSNYGNYTAEGPSTQDRQATQPQNIQEISLETREVDYFSRHSTPDKQEEHASSAQRRVARQKGNTQTENRNDSRTGYQKGDSYRGTVTSKSDQNVNEPGRQRIGSYLSRSLSSSFSSHVGSSDEKEDYQGIYSAYDMAGRSPYGSSHSRRYSQSSLSSSNTSWHQSSTSFSYNMKDLPSLLGSTPENTLPKSSSNAEYKTKYHEDFKITDFNKIKKTPPAIPPKPSRFSSSYTIRLSSGNDVVYEKGESSYPQSPHNYTHQKAGGKVVPVIDFTKELRVSPALGKPAEGSRADNNGLSVREMAKRFTANVTHISSKCHTRSPSEEDTRKVKTESWPKVASIMPQESSPKEAGKSSEISLIRLPHSRGIIHSPYGSVQLRHKDDIHKEDLASHRLSLIELIRLHEEQIAMHTKSANTQVYLRRSASDVGRQRPDVIAYGSEQQYSKDDSSRMYHESSFDQSVEQHHAETVASVDTKPNKASEGLKMEYEVREMSSPTNSPFKVIELTDKASDSPTNAKERTPRVKRHRTIGIVGFRHQIDRTVGAKTEPKQKRHTAIGIINVEAIPTTQESPRKISIEEIDLTRDYNAVKANSSPDITEKSVEVTEERARLPVKVFDIDSIPMVQDQFNEVKDMTSNQANVQPWDAGFGRQEEEKLLVVVNAEECYSSVPMMEELVDDSDLYVDDLPVRPPPPDYQPQTTTTSDYKPHLNTTSDYGPQITTMSDYKPHPTTMPVYQPQPPTMSDFKPLGITMSDYHPQGTTMSDYKPHVTTTSDYKPHPTTMPIYQPQLPTMSDYQSHLTTVTDNQPHITNSSDYKSRPAIVADYQPQTATTSDYKPRPTTVADCQPHIVTTSDHKPRPTTLAHNQPQITTMPDKPQLLTTSDYKPHLTSTSDYKPYLTTVTDCQPQITTTPDNKPQPLTTSDFQPPVVTDLYNEPFKDLISLPVSVTTTPPTAQSPIVELDTSRGGATARYRAMASKPSMPIPQTLVHTSGDIIASKPIHSDTHLYPVKTIPVAHISPVNSQHIFGNKYKGNDTKTSTTTSLTPPEPQSAQEMYETRLAMWNLLPGREGVSGSSPTSDSCNHPTAEYGQNYPMDESMLLARGSKTRLSEGFLRRQYDSYDSHKENKQTLHPKTEEYYLAIIDRLTREKQALKEKNESEKREFKQMYEEQKKVANAYQKLEDRYRRRVHELQDALAGCTCQGTLMMYQKSLKSSSARSDNSSERSKVPSARSLHILDELEEWLSKQSKNTKRTKTYNASRDSLISSSSDLTGTGWDDHYELMGAIDQLNGTHV